MTKQLELFAQSTSKQKLPTNLTADRHSIHRWFNFIAGFSPEFVTKCLDEQLTAKRNGRLIDPFAGLSTALVQANIEGIVSVGFETHPFFYDVSLAKLFPPRRIEQINAIRRALESVKSYDDELANVWAAPASTFLSKLVPGPTLRILASALLQEARIDAQDRMLYRLILSRVLEYAAQAQTDGIYKAPTSRKNSIPYGEALAKVCDELREDIALTTNLPSLGKLHFMSSESMTPIRDESCSICITSPPYLNNFDFAEMTRMELYFWRYAASWREITERVRRRLIVNTTTAPTDIKRDQDRFASTLSPSFRAQLSSIVRALVEQRRIRAGKKDYCLLIYPYFAQMQSVFRELRRVLIRNSPFHLVVADAALYGVHIRTETLLADLMKENGFKIIMIDNLRSRGDRWVLAKRQGANSLGEYHIHAIRV
jgi:DNA modification methylase